MVLISFNIRKLHTTLSQIPAKHHHNRRCDTCLRAKNSRSLLWNHHRGDFHPEESLSPPHQQFSDIHSYDSSNRIERYPKSYSTILRNRIVRYPKSYSTIFKIVWHLWVPPRSRSNGSFRHFEYQNRRMWQNYRQWTEKSNMLQVKWKFITKITEYLSKNMYICIV